MLAGKDENREFLGGNVQGCRKGVLRMMVGVVIVLIFSALLALIIYLYQEHVDYLNKKIENLQFELDLTTECLDAHVEMVDDLEGYYDKWRETVNKLDEANQKIYDIEVEKAQLEFEVDRLEYELEQKDM